MYGPIDDIIPREPQPEVKELIDKLSIIIDKFVDFGSNVLKWDTEIQRTEMYNSPILMSYRHFLELADSVSILVKQSSVDPCKLLLRGMLEAYFNLSYMFEADTADRGMAFLVWHLHKQLKDIDKADPDTEVGRQFRAILKKDKLTCGIKLPIDPNLNVKRAAIKERLQDPVHQKAEQEYQRLLSQKNKKPEWYQLFSGRKNLAELADKLSLPATYDTVYRSWSGPTHVTDIIRGKISLGQNGGTEIFQLRHFGAVDEVAQWVLTLCLMMFELYIENRMPNRHNDYLTWYRTIREPYIRITNKEPLIEVI